jgi:hypothetical protein
MVDAAQWFAFHGMPKEEVFKRAGLIDTGRSVPFGPANAAYGRTLSGWLVVVCLEDLFPDPALQDLAADGWAIYCAFNEAVRYSCAFGYQRGQLLWSLMHDEPDGPFADLGLDARGSPPDSFQHITERLLDEQAQAVRDGRPTEGLFRTPMELCFEICGFRADGPNDWDPGLAMTGLSRRPSPTRRRRLAQALGGAFGRGA